MFQASWMRRRWEQIKPVHNRLWTPRAQWKRRSERDGQGRSGRKQEAAQGWVGPGRPPSPHSTAHVVTVHPTSGPSVLTKEGEVSPLHRRPRAWHGALQEEVLKEHFWTKEWTERWTRGLVTRAARRRNARYVLHCDLMREVRGRWRDCV